MGLSEKEPMTSESQTSPTQVEEVEKVIANEMFVTVRDTPEAVKEGRRFW